ncbi:MAG TPA: hypothetical protein VM600_03760 [Actinomycetota bacterium]|nr:hypothetical protein [Actinomycetota bacterium]
MTRCIRSIAATAALLFALAACGTGERPRVTEPNPQGSEGAGTTYGTQSPLRQPTGDPT